MTFFVQDNKKRNLFIQDRNKRIAQCNNIEFKQLNSLNLTLGFENNCKFDFIWIDEDEEFYREDTAQEKTE